MNKIKLEELIEKYSDKPTDVDEFVIDGTKYIVTSHYCGNKDIDEVLTTLAIKQAYKDMQCNSYNNFGAAL